MLSQINLVFIFILVTIDLANRLFIGTLRFIFLVCKVLCSLHYKSEELLPFDEAIYFNSINYPDELDYTPYQ